MANQIDVGGKIDLDSKSSAEAVGTKSDEQLNDILNFGSARTDQVLAEAKAYGLSTHQESEWDPELLTLNPDGLLKATAGQGATLRIEADASSQSDLSEINIDTSAQAIGWSDADFTTTSEEGLNVEAVASSLGIDNGTNNILNTNSLSTAIDGNDENETTTLTITSNVEADALATAQLSGVNDSSIIESLQAHSIGINSTDINLIGEGFVQSDSYSSVNIKLVDAAELSSEDLQGDDNTVILLDEDGSSTLLAHNQVSIDEAASGVTDAEYNIGDIEIGESTSASSYGIQGTTIFGDGDGINVIDAEAVIEADFSNWAGFTGSELDEFVAMGLNETNIILGKGADIVRGEAVQDIKLSDTFDQGSEEDSALEMTLTQSAGINNSAINTGAGDDLVEGKISGEGIHLDTSRGIVDSYINTSTGDDEIKGSVINSVLHGGSGDDRIEMDSAEGSIVDAGSGDDRIAIANESKSMQLFGGTGEDIIIGGNGNDMISGGVGSDVLRGGEGADRFVFDVSSFGRGTDIVSDFNSSEGDALELSAALTGINRGAEPMFITAAMAEGVNNDAAMIYDTLENIQGQQATSIKMAYAHDIESVMFDQDGDWTQGSDVLAVVRQTDGSSDLDPSDIKIV
ncbi:MAG: calcium-binding protein [Cyanobacteriota bacterium]|nr:calcium-binding protein [Cyanobacteriota bacterium]